jgi:hypothetical protein
MSVEPLLLSDDLVQTSKADAIATPLHPLNAAKVSL